MRTTVTLDPDAEQIVKKRMRERGESFKEAVNALIRAGSGGRGRAKPFRTQTASMGRSVVPLDRALQLAGELEDEELLRRSRAGR
jgi:hypothetical protein